jgi:hypothetical protein
VHCADGRGTRLGIEGLPAAAVIGMEVQDTGACVDGRTAFGRQFRRRAGYRGMLAIPVQGCL